MGRVYIYVVARDFGFAPNPFHGYCTLATCKPGIRNKAEPDDWIIGMGGTRLKAVGRCVFAMRVTQKITFNEYWTNPTYMDKKPVRNGSRIMMVGDNVYHFDSQHKKWYQAKSHHSHPDGSINERNLCTDTKSDKVLLSRHFFYLGKEARIVPEELLNAIGYENQRNYRVFDADACKGLIGWLGSSFGRLLNQVPADPFDFADSHAHYSGSGNKILK